MDVLHLVIMVIAVAVTTGRSFAIPGSDEHKSRVVDHVSMYCSDVLDIWFCFQFHFGGYLAVFLSSSGSGLNVEWCGIS